MQVGSGARPAAASLNTTRNEVVLCQVCGTANPGDGEFCRQCGTKLLVVSGIVEAELEPTEEIIFQAQEELEEHMLERITSLEEKVRRLSQALASSAQHLTQLEHNLTVAHAGIQSLAGLLEAQGIVTRTEVVDGWERVADLELLSRDLSRRFQAYGARILSQATHSGHASDEFTRKLRAVELALVGPETGEVRELLTDLVRMAPESDELWSFIGEAAFQTGELETARIAFRKVLELRGPQFEALVYLGAVASDLGLWQEAEDALEKARKMAPDTVLPHFTLGALKVVLGEHGEAIAHIERSLAIEETSQSWYLLGICHLEMGKNGSAIKALQRAVELAPEFEDALYQLGIAYLRRGWTKKALGAFQQVLKLDPQRLQYQETVRMLKGAPQEDLPPRAAQLVATAEAALDANQADTAHRLFVEALEQAPEEPGLLASAALVATISGHFREAVSFAHTLLRDRPENSPYLAAAVVAVFESIRLSGKPRLARLIARRIHSEKQGDELARAMTAYELALLEAEIGEDLDRARSLAREALEIAPKELRRYPLSALGAIALKRERYREATQYLEQSTRTDFEPSLLRQLALARLGSGDATGAEAALNEADSRTDEGINHEFLGHLRRLGGLANLTRNHRPAQSNSAGRRS